MSQMSTSNEIRDLDALMKSIDALEPTGERIITTKFVTLHANIEQALARGVTQRAVMEALERDGLKLHPAKFKKLLEETRALHSESGEGNRCRSCGALQMTPSTTESKLDGESVQLIPVLTTPRQ